MKGWIYLAGAAILSFIAKSVVVQQAPAGKDKLTPAQRAFINAINKYSAEIFEKYQIQPAVLLSQAALESGYGTSGLAKNGKNLFGIKESKAWAKAAKPVWTGVTHEFVNGKEITITDRFKKYDSWKASIYDWAELISSVYKTAYGYAKAGYITNYGQAIVNTGYSTHPQYASLITGEFKKIATA
jgi:flagellum-specific peptidoglycan hydrolase FlgJ